jgi:hypothetical protein
VFFGFPTELDDFVFGGCGSNQRVVNHTRQFASGQFHGFNPQNCFIGCFCHLRNALQDYL